MSITRPQPSLTRLTQFLNSKQCHDHSMNIDQLDGYLRAIASAPMTLEYGFYSELIFTGEKTRFINKVQKNQLTQDVVALLDFHRQQVEVERCDVLFELCYNADQAQRIAAEQWCRGFMQGYIIVEKEWEQLLSSYPAATAEGFNQVLDDALECVSVVADAEFALQQGTDTQAIRDQFTALPMRLQQLASLGQQLGQRV